MMEELTLFKALSSPVVSPPISTVIPLIRFATTLTSLKMGVKKARIISEHEKSTDISNRCLESYNNSFTLFFLLFLSQIHPAKNTYPLVSFVDILLRNN